MIRSHAVVVLLAGVILLAALRPVTADTVAGAPALHRTLTTAIVDNYHPYTFVHNGQPAGFSVDLARAVTREMGLDLVIRVAAWDAALHDLSAGAIDFLPMMAYSRERDRLFEFSVPHTIAYDAIFTRRGTVAPNSPDGLVDKRIIVMESDQAHNYLMISGKIRREQLILVQGLPQALRLLNDGTGDAALMPKLVGMELVRQLGLSRIAPSPAIIEEYTRPFSFAVRENDRALLERLNQGLNIVKASGEYDAIYRRWFGNLEPQGIPFDETLRYAGWFVGVAALAVLLLLTGNMALKREVARRTRELQEENQARRMSEESLRKSEERYRSLVDGIGMGIAMISRDHTILMVNSALSGMFAKPADEFVGRKCWQEFEKRDAVCGHCPGVRAMAEGLPAEVETEGVRDDQTTFWVRNRAFPVFRADGEADGFIEVIQDITAEKRRLHRERQDEERHRLIIQTALDGFWLLDSRGRFVDVNEAACELCGYSRAELLALCITDIEAGESAEQIAAHIRAVMQGGKDRFESRHRCKDGRIIEVEVSAQYLAASGMIVAFVRDISERKQVAEELTKSRNLFQNVIDSSSSLIYATDLDGRFLLVNSALERLFGVERAAMIGRTRAEALAGIMPPEIAESHRANDRKVAESGCMITFEETNAEADGIHYYQTLKNPLRDLSARIYGVAGISTDITERKRAEVTLLASEENYRLLFQNMNTYNSMYEVVLDGDGRPADYRFLMVNRAYEEYVGKTAGELIGRTLREVYPATEQYWLDKMAEAVLTGRPLHFESFSREMNTFTEINLFTPQKGRLAMTTANISERRRIEEALRRSEKSLRESQRIARVGSWHLDLATDKVIWSEELYRMYGFDPTQPPPPYAEHSKLFTTESWGKLSAALANARETGNPYVLELETVRQDGSNGWMWVQGEAEHDTAGNIVGLWGAAQDITERKRTEEELRRKERQLNETGRIAQVGGWEIDLQANRLTWTDETMRIHEVEPGYLPTVETAINFYHPEDRPVIERLVRRAVADGEDFDRELRIRTATGREKWVRAQGVAEKRGDTVVRVSGAFHDITERKLAEQALQESELRLTTLHRNLSDTMLYQVVVGPGETRRFAYVSDAVERLHGVGAAAVYEDARTLYGQIVAEDLSMLAEREMAAFAAMSAFSAEVRMLIPGFTEPRWRRLTSSPRHCADGSVAWDGVEIDITETRALYARVTQSEKLAAVGQLAAGVAHEFNNILAIIRTHAQIALMESTLPPALAEKIVTIEAQTQRGATVVSDLSALAKADTVSVSPCQVLPAVEEALAARRSFLKDNGVAAQVEVEHNLTVLAERHRLGRIFDNLIVNACHAMKTQGGGTLSIACRKRDGMAAIVFADSGPGMPPEVLTKVFLPFYTTKGSRAGGSLPGTGLGLWVCHSLANAFGGTITVASPPGTGAVFTVSLRLAPAIRPESSPADTPAVLADRARPCRVLLVDDELPIIASVSSFLRDAGHEVTCCARAEEALACLAPGRFDIAVIDYNLPRMNGRELAARIRIRQAARHIVYITGMLDADETLAEETARGDCTVLTKPFDLADLARLVRIAAA